MAPIYLLACLVLGGSAQGIWQNMILQLGGLVIIAWAAAEPSEKALPSPVKAFLLLAIAAIVVVLLQLIPLPASFRIGATRRAVIESYQLLGRRPPALPVSLTPYESQSTLLCIIPPLALFCAIVRLKASRPTWLAAALLGGAVAGTMLGALQVAGWRAGSTWYLYPETSVGLGVGFFANANHMASLLVIAIPFVAAIAAAARSRNTQRYLALLMVLGALAVVLLVGIALNGSLAGYLLTITAIPASALILLPPGNRSRLWLALLSAFALVLAIGALATTEIGASKISLDATGSVQSRAVIFRTTSRAISDNLPLGTGLGSFLRVYRLYESPQEVTNEYVIHAHNDYAELALELGAPGILLIMMFLALWLKAVWSVWRKNEGGPFTRAASIASAAVLVHSLVDFPLRTAAISACFAMCLALLADRRLPARGDATDLRPTRHLVFT